MGSFAEQSRVPPSLQLPISPVTKIALCQLSVTSDKERNIAHARKATEQAVEKGAQLVVLPCLFGVVGNNQIWNSPYANASFPVYAEDIDAGGDASPSTAMLSEVARNLKVTIVGGSIPFYIFCLVYLYCAHLICYPGAFNMTTGPLHWELLQRARAVDNQLYVATCSPSRDAGAGNVAWGQSTLVGPFGEVLATTEHDESIIIAEIDYSLIELRRTNLPLEKQRRRDLYQLVDVQRQNQQLAEAP
ncbi:hypothetical protein MKW92_033295 [Papaver armeniacum]|nr:hypothetical protein MKW92_033295 [Papaver armeniacum]